MDLRDYLKILRKGWLLITAMTILGVVAGIVATMLLPQRFESTTQIYVSVQGQDSATAGDVVEGSSAAQLKVQSYVDAATSARVLAPVIKDLHLQTTPAGLAKKISVESPENTVLLNITAQGASPKQAATIANAVGRNFKNLVVNQLDKPNGSSRALVRLTTLEQATPPSSAVSPRRTINVGLGFLIGLIIGITAAVIRSVLDNRIRTPQALAAITNAPILGGIVFDAGFRKHPLLVQSQPHSPTSEAIRAIRTNLQFIELSANLRTFVFTSPLPGEGKTVTTANLSIALADTGSRVLLVDGDLRRPQVAEIMGLEGAVGLTDVLVDRVELSEAIQPWGRASLSVLPAGTVPPNPSELIGSPAMAKLVNRLNESFDYVLIDSPPVIPVTDASILSKLAGGSILIAASGRTKIPDVEAAVTKFKNIDVKILGIIASMLPIKGVDASEYGASYYGKKREVTASLSRQSRRPRRAKRR